MGLKHLCTANEGPVKIQYKCLVPIYVFPEMKHGAASLFPNRIIMFSLPIPTYTHIYVRNLYIYRIGQSMLLQKNMCTNSGNI
jgi:hypothetical protein